MPCQLAPCRTLLCASSGVGERVRPLDCSALPPADGDDAWGFGRMAKRGQGANAGQGSNFGAGLVELGVEGKDGVDGIVSSGSRYCQEDDNWLRGDAS